MRFSTIRISFKSAKKPPFFIGSQVRVAFGYALKDASCISRTRRCERCFAQNECLYYDFFERPSEYRKYRFDFVLYAPNYDFSVILFLDACDKLPYVVSALSAMLKKRGLGRERATYAKFDMSINGKNCLKNGEINLPKIYWREFSHNCYYSDVRVFFCNTTSY